LQKAFNFDKNIIQLSFLCFHSCVCYLLQDLQKIIKTKVFHVDVQQRAQKGRNYPHSNIEFKSEKIN